MKKEEIEVLYDAFALLRSLDCEPDEDSALGMGYVSGRISEDNFYSVQNKIEQLIKQYGLTSQ